MSLLLSSRWVRVVRRVADARFPNGFESFHFMTKLMTRTKAEAWAKNHFAPDEVVSVELIDPKKGTP